ncbi:hypothetical protein LX86_007953 [Lentzea aerocolonigenes]|nr:hypothetical protein [Lentzea aerocolonigenes]
MDALVKAFQTNPGLGICTGQSLYRERLTAGFDAELTRGQSPRVLAAGCRYRAGSSGGVTNAPPKQRAAGRTWRPTALSRLSDYLYCGAAGGSGATGRPSWITFIALNHVGAATWPPKTPCELPGQKRIGFAQITSGRLPSA